METAEPREDTRAVVIGRYELIERIGAGGMGVVWKAFDPELNRGVALKLASSGNEAARRRARDEGRALARLSHPNVVPIHDVVEHESGVYLVMELIKGRTLRELAAQTTVINLVRAYRQAGDGLAAAHESGLVHRDFKPDNAIMGADGRVRVLDFGLAHELSAEPRDVAGTPRYMAPEQRTGESLTPAADQYALCTALREAVSSRGQIPRWLQPILARGASEKPADRFPSMHALLAQLTLDPATRWRRRGVAALGVAAVGVGVGAFTIGRSQQEESPCEGGAALIASSWSADRRAAITKHLGELATPYAAEAAPRIISSLDSYSGDWVRLYKSSCQAHRRGEISPALHDRRSGCLSRRRAALSTVTEIAGAVTAGALPNLVVAVGELPDIGACDNDDALVAGVEPPSPAAAAQAASIADDIARIDVERDAGKLDDAKHGADDAVARADALGYRPLQARARIARGRILLTGLIGDRGSEDFRRAAYDALAVGDEPLSVEAYARLAYAIASTAGPQRATEGLDFIEALAEGAGDQARFARALLAHNVGAVAMSAGDRAAARAAFQKARALAAGVEGSGAIELTIIPRGLLLVTDSEASRDEFARELIATRTRLLGEGHPLTLDGLIVAAQMIPDPARALAEISTGCHALAQFHPSMGGLISDCGIELTVLATVAGDKAAALSAARLVAAAANHGANPEQVALAVGYRQLAEGDTRAAAATFADAFVAADETATWWWRKYMATEALLGSALAQIAANQNDLADASLKKASALSDQIANAMPPPVLARRRRVIEHLAQEIAKKR